MTRGQLVKMMAAGFRIGSHSVSHPPLTDLSGAQVREEIVRSKEMLENAFECRVTAFCYPYGVYSPELETRVAEAGYSCAVTTRVGRRHRAEERFRLKRIPISSAQGLLQFVYRLLWAGGH